MGRWLLGGIAGGVVIFMWGFVAHMVLPLGGMGMSEATPLKEEGLKVTLNLALPDDGLYMFPGIHADGDRPTEEEMNRHMEAVTEGPFGLIVYSKKSKPMTTGLAIQAATDLLTALMIGLILLCVPGAYIKRVFVAAVVGLVACLSILVPYWNWYGYPLDFVLAGSIEAVVGALAGGAVIAAIVKPAKAGKTAA